jgi:anti-anti-sigma regulatory factor
MTRQEQLFSARLRRNGRGTHLVLTGELDLLGVPLLERELERALTQGVRPILVDVSSLTFCDLVGQRALLRCLEAGAAIVGTPPRGLERFFEITRRRHLLPEMTAAGTPGQMASAQASTS